MKPYINPLSAHGQFRCIDDVMVHLSCLVEVFYYLLPSVQRSRFCIVFDPNIESRSLIDGENFSQTLNRMKGDAGGRDAVLKWYLFTRKHCVANVEGPMSIQMHAHGHDPVGGLVAADVLTDGAVLLSIGGSAFTESLQLRVYTDLSSVNLSNAHSLETIYPLTPRYEPSAKHRLEPYLSNGVVVSPMPLNVDEAQKLLLEGVIVESDYWALRRECGRYFRFKRTHVDRLIYHGFQVQKTDIPESIIMQLER